MDNIVKTRVLKTEEVNSFANLIAKIGRVLVQNGAEIYRVEDTINRICHACEGISNINIYATYNMIIVSFTYMGKEYVKMRRIRSYSFELNKVSEINDFSRKFVKGEYTIAEGAKIVEEIGYGSFQSLRNYCIYGGIGAAMLIFNFGGNGLDFIGTLISGFFAVLALFKVAETSFSFFFNNVVAAFVGALLAVILVKMGIGSNVEIVITGAMIPLLPGVYFTNAIRDFMVGDLFSGIYASLQSLLVAAGMALGAGIVMYFYY